VEVNGKSASTCSVMYDLIVIGGGPAGTAAAISSARTGARVLLLERGRFPRHKVCGEFVSAESLGVLENLLDSLHANLLEDAIRIDSGRMFIEGRVLRMPVVPPAASVARLDLDEGLWRSAVSCGVDGLQQVVVQRITGAGPFTVSASSGDYEGRAVVNASGRWSNLTAKAWKQRAGGEKWIGLKAHFAEMEPPRSVDLYFFEGGYCGVQPVQLRGELGPERVNACAMVKADVASSIEEVLALHPALWERARNWKILSDPISVGPLLFRKPQPEAESVFMVGDAAAFVDPFIGDGISLALRSGVLAAENLMPFYAGKIDLERAVSSYAEQYRRRLAPVFQASSKIRRVLNWPRSLRAPILFLLENTPRMTQQLVRMTR